MTIWNPQLERFTGPRYRTIADAIAADIQSGTLPAGYRMPTHRDLADQLGVTVGTITRGYAEAARRGLLRGETGRGTHVAGGSESKTYLNHSEDNPQNAVDMGLVLPLNCLDPNLALTLRKLAEQPDLQDTLRYYPSKGRRVDREIGARWLEHHYMEVSPDQVLLSAGGQHAIAIVMSGMFRPGDSIAVANVTYPLFKTLAHRLHLKLVPIGMDQEGMVPEELESACRTQRIAGLYCIPTCHNPTTAAMSRERREAIASAARKHDLYIIEDDVYAQLTAAPYCPISKLAPERSFFLASFSKSVCCGLRYGYLVCPPEYNHRMEQAIADSMWMVSPITARIARQLIEDGTAIETIRNKRNEARRRNQLAQTILTDFQFSAQETGYFIWLHLPEPWNSTDFAREANEQNVIVTPDEHFIVGRSNRLNSVRIALSGPNQIEELGRGLQVIKELLIRN